MPRLSDHGVDQSGDTLLWDGIPLNLQKIKMEQVSQVAVGIDVGIYRSL